MNLQDYKGVYVFVQQVDNKITGVSFELIGKAKELAAAMETEVTLFFSAQCGFTLRRAG